MPSALLQLPHRWGHCRAVLHEAVKIALGPGNKRTKMAALKVVLDFSQSKPDNAR
jgi:hypothetical protein